MVKYGHLKIEVGFTFRLVTNSGIRSGFGPLNHPLLKRLGALTIYVTAVLCKHDSMVTHLHFCSSSLHRNSDVPAWLFMALAFKILRPGQSHQWQLASAQLWPKLWLKYKKYKYNTNLTFNHLIRSLVVGSFTRTQCFLSDFWEHVKQRDLFTLTSTPCTCDASSPSRLSPHCQKQHHKTHHDQLFCPHKLTLILQQIGHQCQWEFHQYRLPLILQGWQFCVSSWLKCGIVEFL